MLALDLLGLAVALATGADDLGHALVVGTPINAPFTFVAVQALIVLAATRHRAGAAVLGRAVPRQRRLRLLRRLVRRRPAAAERAIQLGLVTATAALGAARGRAAVRPRTQAVAVG